MRCPKCGFISFDHLTSCAKCGKDIADVAAELQGTSIKTGAPMFLSTALAAFAEREESLDEHTMDADVSGGIDFSMDDEPAAAAPSETVEAGGDIDFSFEEGEAEDAGAMQIKAEEEEAVDITLDEEPEAAPGAAEESLEELDFMAGAADEEEEGGLEFDLEDFIEEMDQDTRKSSGETEIDLDLDDEEQ